MKSLVTRNIFQKIRKNTHFIIILSIIAICLGIFVYSYWRLYSVTTIIFTDQGFTPQEITIANNTKITFVNKSKRPFWPASNLHPTHTVYAGFDAKQAIKPGETWSFTFTKTGIWSYHDHLNSFLNGSIRVSKTKSSFGLEKDIDCSDKTLQEGNKIACWERMVDKEFRQKGLEEAFNMVGVLSQSQPLFAANCHDYTHKLGQLAYQVFDKKGDISLPLNTSFCAYGFYHGIIEAMHIFGKDLKEAKKFCDFVEKKMSGMLQGAGSACYHGIGHGNVDFTDKRLWGDAQAIAQPALSVCDQVASSQEQLFRCTSGVYNSLSMAFAGGAYNLTIPADDPLWLCHTQEDRYKRGCYDSFTDILLMKSDSFLSASQKIENISDTSLAKSAQVTLSSFQIRELLKKQQYDFNYSISVCGFLEMRLQDACMDGLVSGLLEFGEPDKEYERAITLCSLSQLNQDQKKNCFHEIWKGSLDKYPPQKIQEVCNLIGKEYCKRGDSL